MPGLDRDRLLLVAQRVREVHGSAYDWPGQENVPDDVLALLVDQWASFGSEKVEVYPRQFLRNLINLLDLCQQNPGVPAEEFLGGIGRQSDGSDPMLDLLAE